MRALTAEIIREHCSDVLDPTLEDDARTVQNISELMAPTNNPKLCLDSEALLGVRRCPKSLL